MSAEELELAVLTAVPGDPVFAVWGDALADEGDPRGALVSLCRQLEHDPGDEKVQRALAELVAANADAWCPGCLDDDDTLRLTWRDGFIDAVTFDGEPMAGDVGYGQEDPAADAGAGSALHRLISAPMAARISSLSLRAPIDAEGNHGCWGHHEAFVARLIARDWPWLRSLDFDGATLPRSLEHGRGSPELSFLRFGELHDAEITVGDLSALWKRAPRLQHLALAQPTGVMLGQVHAPALRTFVFGSADSESLNAIAEGKLPLLETLIVRVDEPADVASLLRSRSIGAFKHLGLIATPSGEGEEERGDEILRVLVESDRCEQLETLDLGGLDATERGWSQLVHAAPRFKRLQSLRLTTWALDPSVAKTDDWMENSIEFFSGPHFAPRQQPIGRFLEQALPVRWMTASIVSVVENTGRKKGLFYGFLNSDGYAEDRG
ncbi:MAG: hypothetical protein Q8N23_27310 [Archangium sp.]|nr:hypothetical protein [Archangium sp.]MDP3573139.1 hypothetical protein [Archangium sp.]